MMGQALIFVRNFGDKTLLTTIVDSKDVEGLKGEHQHLLAVKNNPTTGFTDLCIMHNVNVNRTNETKGQSINGILTQGILTQGIWQN